MIAGRPSAVRRRGPAVSALTDALSATARQEPGWVAELLHRESPVPVAAIDSPDLLETLVHLNLVGVSGDRVVPLVRMDRVDSLLVASDLRRHRRSPDFVVGPGPASFLLARHVRPVRGGRALDLGCGSGIQSLLLASAGMSVTAIDVNPRALGFARFNAALNGLPRIAPMAGDFLAEAPDRRFDGRYQVVVSNPPFVLAPAARLVYRDRPLPGDQVGSRTVERVSRAVARGGKGYVLCNWIGDSSGDWAGPVRRWIQPLGLDANVTRVAGLTPASYAAVWNRDLPEQARREAIAHWAAGLEAEGVRRVDVGVITLDRPERQRPDPRRLEAVDLVG